MFLRTKHRTDSVGMRRSRNLAALIVDTDQLNIKRETTLRKGLMILELLTYTVLNSLILRLSGEAWD